MQQMREAVGIEKVLGIVGAANAAGPNQQLSTGTNPQAAFKVKKDRDSNE